MSAYFRLLICAAALGLVAAGHSPDAEDPPDPSEVDVAAFSSPTVAPLTRMGIAVGVVSAIGWALAVWVRRRSSGGSESTPSIRVLAKRSIGPRHHVALIEAGEHRLLIGLGGDSIRTLADLTPEKIFEAELERELPSREAEGSGDLLEQIGAFQGLDG